MLTRNPHGERERGDKELIPMNMRLDGQTERDLNMNGIEAETEF